ncbi:MAG: hypothetical protein ABIR62_14935 [Dokdonella sp.]|uniref:hypothetical protein n=1 Tax=Dokdonella sp. TaxID=2291710 RepID=UPI003266AACE
MSFVCALGFASIAEAQAAAPLDLSLPASSHQPVALPSGDSSPSNPGKYYGDGTDSESLIDRTTVSGSVSSTVGYSKAYGTGFGTSADINLSTQMKNGNTVNINVGVSRSDGLPISRYGYSGYRFGPRY